MTFLGWDLVITVRHAGLGDLRAELEAVPGRLRLGPAPVLYTIADRVVGSYLAVIDAFEVDVDEIESVVFTPRSPVGAEQMYLLKRRSWSCVAR